jgi:hypothetical protein
LPERILTGAWDLLAQDRGTVIVFLPNTNELQRFVFAGAFDRLAQSHALHFVLPEADAETMRTAGAPAITAANSSTLHVPLERFRKWQEVFHAGCVHYANLSPSFALRAGLDPDPNWAAAWTRPAAERDAIHAEFDANVRQLLSGMEPLPELVALLERLNPVFCVVPTSLLDLFCNDVVWACETAKVSCVLLQSGWDNLSSKGLLYWRSPFLGCWGPQSREHAKVLQRLTPKRTGLLGAPHYEFLTPASPEDRAEMRASLGVAPHERLILFGGSFRQFDETGTLATLERAIIKGRLPGVKIVYRPHPWRAARQHEDSFFSREWQHVVFDPDMRDRYVREQQQAGYIKRHVPMFDMAYLSRLLSAADAVISPMSTLLVESLRLDKPTMAIAFGDKHHYNPSITSQMTHFAELRHSPALLWCDSSDRLVKECGRLLRRGPSRGDIARQLLLERIVRLRPGTYAERLAEFCAERVEPQGRKLRAERTAANRPTISHAYGAHLIAREYAGVADSDAAVPGYWMHGWIPAYHNVHPALIALHKKEGQHDDYDFAAQIRDEKQNTIQWVSRADQAEYLTAHGYRHVKAIGLPIVYLPDPQLQRVPGSLLVLPPHSHKNHGATDPLAERYADMIAELAPRFSHVAVGVNEDDFTKGQWVESFRRRGIDVFVTTDQADPNTLKRLQRILYTFESVTTNGFGSHIALAAYCGARVSVFGPYAEFPIERMKATHAVKMFPELLDQAHYLCTEQALRTHYPFLFVAPDHASTQQPWGATEVGEPSRLSPEELRRLFGWHGPATAAAEAAVRVAVPGAGATVAAPAAAVAPVPRKKVLFGCAHAGFVRNFEGTIAGLLNAGVHVHVHLSKAHHTISMADYSWPTGDLTGRLTYAVEEGAAEESPSLLEQSRAIRDLLLYTLPVYDGATELRARLPEMHKKVLSVTAHARATRLLRRLPAFARHALDRILRAYEEWTPPEAAASRLLDTLRPDYVMVTPLVNFRSREIDLVKAARRRGIRTLLPVASWDNLTNKGRLKVQPDRIAVWNEAMAREAIELHGVPPARVAVVGASVFDPWFAQEPRLTRAAFMESVGLDPARPLVVYLCSSTSIAGQVEANVVKAWMAAIRASATPPLDKANVLIRPHPMAPSSWAKLSTVDDRGIASWRGAAIWPLEPKHPTTTDTRAEFFDTIAHADAIVGLNTSAMIEAAIIGKPVLTFFDHASIESQTGNLHFRHLAEGGCVFTAPDLGGHVRQLGHVLTARDSVRDACARFVASFVRPIGRDVSASDTLVNLILSDLGLERAPAADRAGSAARPSSAAAARERRVTTA